MSELLDNCVESFLLGLSPGPFYILSNEGGERRNYVCIVRHELLIEVGEAREVSDILRDGPFRQRGYLFGLSSYHLALMRKPTKSIYSDAISHLLRLTKNLYSRRRVKAA